MCKQLHSRWLYRGLNFVDTLYRHLQERFGGLEEGSAGKDAYAASLMT